MDPGMLNKTKRLTRDSTYNRPKKTYQDTLSNDDIKDKLKDYKKVTDIRKVVIGTHIRYFTKDKDNKKVFRLGGFLTKFGEEYKYVVLSNGQFSWSVQNNNTTDFWAKMNSKEIVETVDHEKTEDAKNIEEEYKKLKEKNEYMMKLLKDQHKVTEKLTKKLDAIESEAKKEIDTKKNKKK